MPPAVISGRDRFGLVGTVLERKFRVDRVVASGGFGIVYAAHHLTLETPVAVKVLRMPEQLAPAAYPDFFQRFMQEAKTMARIKHPGIVQVLDTGISVMPSGEQAPWMVLEWLTGMTLKAAAAARLRGGGVTPPEALAVLRPVFEALAYVHDEGIAHRDLKPDNIMLVPTRRGYVVKLLDFGIAKTMQHDEVAGSGRTATRGASAAFSPPYAAPEQVGETRSGPWTDVHAMGLILSELLTGQTPYNRENVVAMYADALAPERPTPRKFGVDVGSLEPVLARALAIKPDHRWKNAGEFLAALDQVIRPWPGADPFGVGGGTPSLQPPLGAPDPRSAQEAPDAAPVEPSSDQVTRGFGPAVGGETTEVLATPRRTGPRWLWIGAAVALVALVAGVGSAVLLWPRAPRAAGPLVRAPVAPVAPVVPVVPSGGRVALAPRGPAAPALAPRPATTTAPIALPPSTPLPPPPVLAASPVVPPAPVVAAPPAPVVAAPPAPVVAAPPLVSAASAPAVVPSPAPAPAPVTPPPVVAPAPAPVPAPASVVAVAPAPPAPAPVTTQVTATPVVHRPRPVRNVLFAPFGARTGRVVHYRVGQ